MNFSFLPISFKLILGFALVTLITLIVGVFSIIKLQDNTTLTKKMFTHPYAVSNSVKNIHIDVLSIHLLAQSLILNSDLETIRKSVKKLRVREESIEQSFALVFEQYLGPKEDVNRSYTLFKKSNELRKTYINLLQTQGIDPAKAFLAKDGSIHMKLLNESILDLNRFANNNANELLLQVKREEAKSIKYLYFMIFTSIALIVFVSIKTINGVINPIHKLIKITNSINSGDLVLSQEIISKFSSRKDEIGTLFNSFHRLMSYLLLPYNDIIKSDRPLAEKTDELRRLLNSFDKYVIASKTDIQGNITYVSQAAQDVTGYSSQELIGKTHKRLRHQDMSEESYQDLWKTITLGKIWHGEIKNKKKDGSFFWIRSVITPDVDLNGNIVGFNSISENVTDRKAYQELSQTLENRISKEILKNNEQTNYLIQQSRLAQMGEMISMIAHQWRQPLSSISAISSTLSLDVMMQNYQEDFFKERLDSIGELSQHLSSTIDDFRNFFKEDKEREEVNLKNTVHDCLQVMSSTLINKGIEISISIDNDILIQSYANELKQVVLNVLKNAEDALLETAAKNPKISILGYKKDSFAYLEIEDNAGGVADAIMNKVFDPYFSTKTKKDGTGLGLYMSKTIIQEHCSGEITLTNSDKGALFIIKLPMNTKGTLS